jgi:DNA-binding CsgD family transcriptional regulator
MTKSCFETQAWHDAVAGMIASDTSEDIAENLIIGIGQAVEHNGTCLLAFHVNAPPEVMHHTLEPEGERHYVERYLAGPYLLDPLYELAVRNDKPAMCRFRDATPDRFHSSEYYKQYCDRTHLKDEMDFLVDVDESTSLALVVGRREKMFAKLELMRLELIGPVVRAAMGRIYERWRQAGARNAPDRAIHQRLTECFENFGDDVLTQREREITQLLLRGHSTKSVARKLNIAPGTVMVHKRNLFQKLGITSQYELFSRFIDELSG